MRWHGTISMLALVVTGCGAPSAPADAPDRSLGNEAVANVAAPEAPATIPAEEPALAAADLARVCRAAMAMLNGHKPAIIHVTQRGAALVRVEYRRPDDGELWKSECRTQGDRVIWRTIDAFGPGSGMGRWRENPADEVIRFSLDRDKVTISLSYPQEPGETRETFTLRR